MQMMLQSPSYLQEMKVSMKNVGLPLMFFVATVFIGAVAKDGRVIGAVGGDGRIIGGEDADENEFPSSGQLRRWSTYICGCNLIGPRTVVTAKHCVDDFPVGSLSVTFGRYQLLTPSANEQLRFVSNVFYKEEIRNKKGNIIAYADVAVLNLTEPILENESIKYTDVYCQPLDIGVTARLAAWGQIEPPPSVQLADKLQKVTVSKVRRADCLISPTYQDEICFTSSTDSPTRNHSCRGDSGSGLYLGDQSTEQLVGVVSAGPKECNMTIRHTLYANLDYHCKWIRTWRRRLECWDPPVLTKRRKWRTWTPWYFSSNTSTGVEIVINKVPCRHPNKVIRRKYEVTSCPAQPCECNRQQVLNWKPENKGMICQDADQGMVAGDRCKCCNYRVSYRCKKKRFARGG